MSFNFGPDREDVYTALWALVTPLIASGGAVSPTQPFVSGARKLRNLGLIPAEQRPALFQVEPMETTVQRTGMFSKRVWKAFWVATLAADPADETDVGISAVNALNDLFEQAITDQGPDSRQTLGGLVHHTFINGQTDRNPGDLAGTGMLVIPVSIMIP